MARSAYVRNAAHGGALEVMVVELLDRSRKVGGCLVFNEAENRQHLPFAGGLLCCCTLCRFH